MDGCAVLVLCVVSYRNSTSNHNPPKRKAFVPMLYLIEILHQTTTRRNVKRSSRCCILSKFYIKPQLRAYLFCYCSVVSYRNSTSNHNYATARATTRPLYLIEILHQTTTTQASIVLLVLLYLIEILHQTTTVDGCAVLVLCVVSYRNSTSNHNPRIASRISSMVVSYRNSTSNHNFRRWLGIYSKLYLIEILHQTTTIYSKIGDICMLYLIEILHQTTTVLLPPMRI